jgi:hypothetical protein
MYKSVLGKINKLQKKTIPEQYGIDLRKKFELSENI